MLCLITGISFAQQQESKRFKKASSKIERGYKKGNMDTLAQGHLDLALTYQQNGDLIKSERHFKLAKESFNMADDAEGVAKSSRGLAKVQEDLNKKKEAVENYETSEASSLKAGDLTWASLNRNDISRLTRPDSIKMQRSLIQGNIDIGIKNKDTAEVVNSYDKLAAISLQQNKPVSAVNALHQAYNYSRSTPEQALKFNQQITDVYVKNKDFTRAIETKEAALNESFVISSSGRKVSEINSLADIYIKKDDINTAIQLLNESYSIAIKNGHTLEAKKSIEKLDSIYRNAGNKEQSLKLYKDFLKALPGIIAKDSSLADNKLIAETEQRLKLLESEKTLKDDLIRKKNVLNFWLTASVIIMAAFLILILYIVRKLKIKNKKIALQSLRREMNPHFIFNSLNSINQFISNNNELAANQYLTKFSSLMRSVMENSKEDFVLFSREADILQKYLELEKSRFPDKFDFKITMDDSLYSGEQLYIPGMLIQPHLENAIWHGLRYMDDKGTLTLTFRRVKDTLEVVIEDNGIGIAQSKKVKTSHQKKHTGRGITNTHERIKILNELYHQDIQCVVTDKPFPGHGVKVEIKVPLLKNIRHED